jgi:hypothetical protein
MCDEAVSMAALGDSCGLDRLDAALASALFSILKPGALLSRINQQMTLSMDAGRALKGRQLFRIIQDYCTVRGTGSAVVAALHALRLSKDDDLPVFLESWEKATSGQDVPVAWLRELLLNALSSSVQLQYDVQQFRRDEACRTKPLSISSAGKLRALSAIATK